MATRITYYPYLKARELPQTLLPLKSPVRRIEELLSQYFGRPSILLNAGRTGIYLALAAYGMRRVDEVLVPRYLPQCVLNTINRTAFPTTHESEHTKAILLLHQFGYPQRAEEIVNYARAKGWLVIEDCAHSFASKYRGKNTGLFSDAAIFSFSKIFPTILGGCLVTEDKRILDFARAYLAEKKGWWRALLSNMSMIAMFMSSGAWSEKARERFKPLLEMCYSQFVEFPGPNRFISRLVLQASLELGSSAIRRKKNLDIFKEYFLGDVYWAELEEECEVVPFLAPYFHENDERLARVVETLRRMNIETEILHFDIQRNMLQPEYKKCVPIPVHQGISDTKMHLICQHIAEAVK